MHVHMSDTYRQKFVDSYNTDPHLSAIWNSPIGPDDEWIPGRRFFKDETGLLYFRDADYQPRLCVPTDQRTAVLREAHESPLSTAHAGPEKLWQKLSQKFYWKRMKADIVRFCHSCDVCQKIKWSNFNKYGFLTPNPIPTRPYESVSMDFVVNLPWSGDYNAVYVVVDRLTKHAQFIPTTTALTSPEFAQLFVKNVVCRFGLPDSIVTDRDPRWTSDFWKGVSKFLKTRMSLSSAHHPQHDGQTEIVNKYLETMLRAYVAGDKSSWAEWLPLLEFAYNSSVHQSIGTSPYFLLYGFHPKEPLDFISNRGQVETRTYNLKNESKEFLEEVAMHREEARNAIARAQEGQAKAYNKGRRPPPVLRVGSKVLVNPHSLEWVESKGEGAKLNQRWIGPFEITEVVNPKVYRLRMSNKYPGLPIFNIEHLREYNESPPEFGVRVTLPDTRMSKKEDPEDEVERIVGHKWDRKKGRYMFLVRWEGYGPQFDTWEPAFHLKNASYLLDRYKRKWNL